MRNVTPKTTNYVVIADGRSALAKSNANFVGTTDAVFTEALEYLDSICADSNVESATIFVREGTYTFSQAVSRTRGYYGGYCEDRAPLYGQIRSTLPFGVSIALPRACGQ